MMREGLLKENIDGEALLWAHERLIGRPEQRRILMVISDGAPVDDAKLTSLSDAIVTSCPEGPTILNLATRWVSRQTSPAPQRNTPAADIETVDDASPATILPKFRSSILLTVAGDKIAALAVAVVSAATAAPEKSTANPAVKIADRR
jgi:hypothetical protein